MSNFILDLHLNQLAYFLVCETIALKSNLNNFVCRYYFIIGLPVPSGFEDTEVEIYINTHVHNIACRCQLSPSTFIFWPSLTFWKVNSWNMDYVYSFSEYWPADLIVKLSYNIESFTYKQFKVNFNLTFCCLWELVQWYSGEQFRAMVAILIIRQPFFSQCFIMLPVSQKEQLVVTTSSVCPTILLRAIS